MKIGLAQDALQVPENQMIILKQFHQIIHLIHSYKSFIWLELAPIFFLHRRTDLLG